MRCNLIYCLVLFLGISIVPVNALNKELVVFCHPLTVNEEPCGIYLHTLEDTEFEKVSTPVSIPGSQLQKIFQLPKNRLALVTSEGTHGKTLSTARELTFLSVIDMNSPVPSIVSIHPLPLDWKFQGATLLTSTENRVVLGIWFMRYDEENNKKGRIDLWFLNGSEEYSNRTQLPYSIPFSGIPIDVIPLGDSSRFAVLREDTQPRGFFIELWELTQPMPKLEKRLSFEPDPTVVSESPCFLMYDPNYAVLLIFSQGYRMSPENSEPICIVRFVNLLSEKEQENRLTFPGFPSPEKKQIHKIGENKYRLITYEPHIASAHVICFVYEPPEAKLIADIPILGATQKLQLALSPSDDRIAISAENRLEIWQGDKPLAISHHFVSPIRYLYWNNNGLYVAESGRVHRINLETGEPFHSIQFQSGHVMLLTEREKPIAPPHTTVEIESPEVIKIREILQRLPKLWVLNPRGRTQFQQSFSDISFSNIPIRWELEFPDQLPPGFTVTISEENKLPVVTSSVNTHLLPQDKLYTLNLGFKVIPTNLETLCEPLIYRVTTVILPPPTQLPRILWMLGDFTQNTNHPEKIAKQYKLQTLKDLLIASPRYFIHVYPFATFPEDLAPYSLIVMNAETLLQGAFTRVAIQRYLAEGGAVLFLGGGNTIPSDAEYASSWFSFLGIRFDPQKEVTGEFIAPNQSGLLHHWERVSIQNGWELSIPPEISPTLFDARVPFSAQSPSFVFLARGFGYGRFAALSSPTPLQNEFLQNETARKFAIDLFTWLINSNQTTNDIDGDFLPDRIEDKNNDGYWSPWETGFYCADSDGDGLIDGKEDTNFNGVVDPGETNPLNTDSDDDGIWDGADESPVPSPDALSILTVEPTTGPAEGGISVLIQGRNFNPSIKVRFGENVSPSVQYVDPTRIIAAVPPSLDYQPQTVDVCLISENTQVTARLFKAFTYEPRTRAILTAQSIPYLATITEGEFTITLRCQPRFVPIGRVSLLITPGRTEDFRLLEVSPGKWVTATYRRLYTREMPGGSIRIEITEGENQSTEEEVAVVRWQSTKPLSELKPVRITFPEACVFAANGAPLQTEIGNFTIEWIQLR